MSGFPYVMILSSTRPLSEIAFRAIGVATALLAESSNESLVDRTTENFEIHIRRTGKYGVIGSFGGEEIQAHYADDRGLDVQVCLLANRHRLAQGSQLRN